MQEITKKIQKYCIHFMDIINMNYTKCHYIYIVYYNDQNAAYIYTYLLLNKNKRLGVCWISIISTKKTHQLL